MSYRLATASIVAVLLATSACSSPELSRDEFISELETSEPPVPPAISNCAFDEISLDAALLDDLAANGVSSNDISVETSDKLKVIMARCILEANEEEAGNDSPDS